MAPVFEVGVGVSPFCFGMPESEVAAIATRLDSDPLDTSGWTTYAFDESVLAHIEDGAVVSIACYDSCFVKDVEIIGAQMSDVRSLLKLGDHDAVEVIELADGPQLAYEFENAGLQLWVKEGKVYSISCYGDD